MTAKNIVIKSDDEARLRKELERKKDADSARLTRYLNMPDLSRAPGNPLKEMVDKIIAIPEFKGFETIQVPEIVPADVSFDLFNFPADHPARGRSDTYYVNDEYILRTHTTIMWYYYLNHPAIKERVGKGLPVGAICHGKVYRKDEIDRRHMNVFHQLDGWYLLPKKDGVITQKDLEEILGKIAKAVFGPETKFRFNKDEFPYTAPSIEMEIDVNGKWVEVLGGGVVRQVFLRNLGLQEGEYTGWAFGFGLERLAIVSMDLPDIRLLWSKDARVLKQLKLGNKFVEVSKYPPITRDISFVVGKTFIPNNYFDLIRDIGGDLVEQVELLDKYEDAEKFGPDRVSYTYRIVYRSPERTLNTTEVEPLQSKLYEQTRAQFNAQLR
ncbi:MAG: hypothetical protein U1C57_01880 [Candidatus Doudnabacteria bacterium]|nr:hypothetical protein [Candidatus Doudnabacteria bacterium]